jgi:hypothetical protein
MAYKAKVWDGSEWVEISAQPADLSGYVPSSQISDISISTSSPSAGDILKYDGSNWVNKSPVVLKLNCIDNSNINDTDVWTNRSIIDDSAAVINLGGFTFNSSTITIPEDGVYQCIFNFFIVAPDTTLYRMNPGARWTINGVLQNEIAASSYIRSEDGHDEASLHLSSVFELSTGNSLKVYWAKLAADNADVYVAGANSNIQIIKIA